jgi:hypothetical protein
VDINGRVPFTLDEAPLTDDERVNLVASHRKRTHRVVDTGELPAVPDVELDVPDCALCHEYWLEAGCPTVRALVRLAVLERDLAEAEKKLRQPPKIVSHFSQPREAVDDTRRLDAVEENQWSPKCVDFKQWEIASGFKAGGEPHVNKGCTVRDAIDDAIARPYWKPVTVVR